MAETPETNRQNNLAPLDEKTSHIPFTYEGNVLGLLRDDQVPRYLGALTHPHLLPTKTVRLSDLIATQNRVDTAKVLSMAGITKAAVLPMVFQTNGKTYIGDGHHRLAALWLKGEEETTVAFKDLEEESNALKSAEDALVLKVDESLGLVFGWAIVSKVNGTEYFDVQGDHIPEHAMLKASADFMANSRVSKEMHVGEATGSVVFAWPMTSEIAKAMGISTQFTGLMIAMKPNSPEILAKYRDGTYTGFSIGGKRIRQKDAS